MRLRPERNGCPNARVGAQCNRFSWLTDLPRSRFDGFPCYDTRRRDFDEDNAIRALDLRIYLREINATPLLCMESERELATKIAAGDPGGEPTWSRRIFAWL